jgi:hypothetical protein
MTMSLNCSMELSRLASLTVSCRSVDSISPAGSSTLLRLSAVWISATVSLRAASSRRSSQMRMA